MTDLQASLIAIGGAIVIGVISYNKWHEYRARKSVQRAFSNEPEDVLMGAGPAQKSSAPRANGDERQEPSFSGADIEPRANSAAVAGFADAGNANAPDASDFVRTIQQKELP